MQKILVFIVFFVIFGYFLPQTTTVDPVEMGEPPVSR
jgi:hypothetical protein